MTVVWQCVGDCLLNGIGCSCCCEFLVENIISIGILLDFYVFFIGI